MSNSRYILKTAVVLFVVFVSSCTGKGSPGRTSLYANPDDYLSEDMYDEYYPSLIELEERIQDLEETINELHERIDNIESEVSDAKYNLEEAMKQNRSVYLDYLDDNLNAIEDECYY